MLLKKNDKGKLIIKKLFNQIKKILKKYISKDQILKKINIEQYQILYQA